MFRLKSTLTALTFAAMMGATALSPLAAQELPGEGTTVNMARATWDTGWFTGEIYKQLLEELGYTVNGPTTLDNPPFYQAVSQGDIDFWVDGWFPLHNTYKPVFEGTAEIRGAVAEGGALEGYLVDKASVEKFNIKTLDDFKREEVKKAFDRDGDGKADLVACPPGWGCEINIEHHLDAYELRDHVNPIKASYSASMADAVAAHEDGQPILFYTWTPNWTVNELKPGEDVMWIEVPRIDLPEASADLADAATVADVEGCVANPCKLGFPANDIVPVGNSEFLKENPAVGKLFEVVSVPLADVFAQNSLMNDGASSEEDLKKQAAEWIENNRSSVDGWLEEAKAAASEG
ncbi:glycine betaine/L-proline ABC transporter substrate-binding protein ProX [Limoniibacter endophyticus]|uniref:Glycine betaine ABC transporter substrate-binding protein n=1 Tax=Limoniibacter endophyticus TaxID=1565040 RepID=A0A8J3DQP6_9HYPH|nr:glycine betaine/L-proline ABC transporter substrate-binding protein ProX [Limoniibacter endophyticus]GHC77669.1 glycine betaine ABC transporter substrate-binding protein [Limoniibacter endophyticus]